MSAVKPTACAGCGGPLPERKGRGRHRKWCSERCRKGSYGQPCIDCGARTSHGAESARVPEPRCNLCASAARAIWTRDNILDAGRWWIREFGEPPAQRDWWSPDPANVLGDEQRAARYAALHMRGLVPNARTVMHEFGGWAGFMVALGYPPRAPHGGGGNQFRRRYMRAKAA